MALDQYVKVVCEALDALADAVYEGKKDDQVLNATRSKSQPPIAENPEKSSGV